MNKKIYIIAGEESGDILAAPLMVELKKELKNISFFGVGGKRMQELGLNSLFPMEELSVMGVVEVLPKLPNLIGRIKQTIKHIEDINPDIVITIDSPDFCFRVAKKLKKNSKTKAKIIHYVAPSVWAWRAGRAKKIAKFLDHILTLLPFEPPYFEKEGLAATFIGHPIMENPEITNVDIISFRKKYNFNKNNRLITVLAGSRRSELKRMLPVFKEVIKDLKKIDKNIRIISPTLPHIEKQVKAELEDLGVLVITKDKYSAMKASDLAIATSGTVALELAVLGTPSIIAYKMGAISSILAKILVKAKYASLPNIILDKQVIPEFLLAEASSENIIDEATKLLSDSKLADKQRQNFAIIQQELSKNSPSKTASEVVLKLIG